jgi:hypothetical protein
MEGTGMKSGRIEMGIRTMHRLEQTVEVAGLPLNVQGIAMDTCIFDQSRVVEG